MSRTITPSEERQRAPRQEAPGRDRSIRPIIEKSVECSGAGTAESAEALVAAAGERSELTHDDAMALAVEETRAERRR